MMPARSAERHHADRKARMAAFWRHSHRSSDARLARCRTPLSPPGEPPPLRRMRAVAWKSDFAFLRGGWNARIASVFHVDQAARGRQLAARERRRPARLGRYPNA